MPDITATVTVDSDPQEGATVYLLDGESLVDVETTDSSGEALFSVPEGEYHVTAEYDGKTTHSNPFIEVE